MFARRLDTTDLVVHCSATWPSNDASAEDIRRWHRERGFIDIGYHFVIRRDGTIESGRPVWAVGAGVEGYNSTLLHICLIGGVKEGHPGRSVANTNWRGDGAEDNFTPAQKANLRGLLQTLQGDYPKAGIKGHRDFPNVRKSCPCFDVGEWWESKANPAKFSMPADQKPADPPKTSDRFAVVTRSAPTFSHLARQHGVELGAFMAANPGVDPARLRVGQRLRLPPA